MKKHRIEQLLQQSLPPVAPGAAPVRDLWPELLRRLNAEPGAEPQPLRANWFDLALLASLIVFAVAFPATISVFLYCL